MKGSRRNFKTLCAVCLSLSLTAGIFSVPITSQAAAVQETEENDTFNTANIIEADQPIKGMIGTGKEDYDVTNDNDYYRFTMPDRGYVSFKLYFDNVDIDDILNGNVHISVYNDEMHEVTTADVQEDNSAATFKIASVKNMVYYVCVYNDDFIGAGDTYILTADFSHTDDYETEPNESIKAVKGQESIKKSIPVNGTIISEKDKDYFKYQNKKKGTIKVSLSIDQSTDDDYLLYNVYLYNKNGRLVKKAEEIKDAVTITAKKQKKGTYYVMVCAYLYDSDPANNHEYSIMIK